MNSSEGQGGRYPPGGGTRLGVLRLVEEGTEGTWVEDGVLGVAHAEG